VVGLGIVAQRLADANAALALLLQHDACWGDPRRAHPSLGAIVGRQSISKRAARCCVIDYADLDAGCLLMALPPGDGGALDKTR
jgi:hypothetical protein